MSSGLSISTSRRTTLPLGRMRVRVGTLEDRVAPDDGDSLLSHERHAFGRHQPERHQLLVDVGLRQLRLQVRRDLPVRACQVEIDQVVLHEGDQAREIAPVEDAPMLATPDRHHDDFLIRARLGERLRHAVGDHVERIQRDRRLALRVARAGSHVDARQDVRHARRRNRQRLLEALRERLAALDLAAQEHLRQILVVHRHPHRSGDAAGREQGCDQR